MVLLLSSENNPTLSISEIVSVSRGRSPIGADDTGAYYSDGRVVSLKVESNSLPKELLGGGSFNLFFKAAVIRVLTSFLFSLPREATTLMLSYWKMEHWASS